MRRYWCILTTIGSPRLGSAPGRQRTSKNTGQHSLSTASYNTPAMTKLFCSLYFRIVIHIDSWEVGSQYPNGHFVRSIGPIGDIETETAVILVEQELAANPFSKALLEGV